MQHLEKFILLDILPVISKLKSIIYLHIFKTGKKLKVSNNNNLSTCKGMILTPVDTQSQPPAKHQHKQQRRRKHGNEDEDDEEENPNRNKGDIIHLLKMSKL